MLVPNRLIWMLWRYSENLTRTEIKGAAMATIMIRYSLSQESFRNILAQEETRESAVRDILAEFGFTFLNMYFSSSKASFIVLADGDPMRVPALEMMYLASGAYVGCECEVLHSPAEVKEQKKLARAVSPKFDAPNRDEIDRMLLDE